jgi:hypothetical protein
MSDETRPNQNPVRAALLIHLESLSRAVQYVRNNLFTDALLDREDYGLAIRIADCIEADTLALDKLARTRTRLPRRSQGVYLELFNGLPSPFMDNDSDAGESGPIFGPFDYVHDTYGADLKFMIGDDNPWPLPIKRELANSCEGEFTIFANECVYYNGLWYGDWSVFSAGQFEKHADENYARLEEFQPERAKMPNIECAECGVGYSHEDAAKPFHHLEEDVDAWDVVGGGPDGKEYHRQVPEEYDEAIELGLSFSEPARSVCATCYLTLVGSDE